MGVFLALCGVCVNAGFIASDWAWRHGPVLGSRGLGLGRGDRWACPESARDDYARVISDRKWPLKKRPVIAISKQDQSALS